MKIYLCREIVIKDLLKDNELKELNVILFSTEDKIDKNSIISLLLNRFSNYKDSFSESEQIDIENYINNLFNPNMFSDFIKCLEMGIIKNEGFDIKDIIIIDRSIFWKLYSVAIKKCTFPDNIDLPDFSIYSNYATLKSKEQKDAHKICHNYFNKDVSEYTEKNIPALKIYFIPFSVRNSKYRTKKKNINRVKKKAKKLMQVLRLHHNNIKYNMFSGKSHIVVDEFASIVIKLL